MDCCSAWELGFSGTNEIFEGKRAMFKAFSDRYDEGKFVEGLGDIFPVNIDFKPYASARPIHNGIDCVLNILRENPQLRPDDIQKITLYRHPDWANYHLNADPKNINEAQVSMPYSVAVSFVKGDAFLEQYDEKLYGDPQIRKIMETISITADNDLPRGVSCLMIVENKKGDQFKSQVDYPKGSKEYPMTDDELVGKFKRLSDELISHTDLNQVVDMILNMEKVGNIETVTQYFQKSRL